MTAIVTPSVEEWRSERSSLVVATRDDGNSEVGDDVQGEVGDESGAKREKVALVPGERARTNLALLYGGPGRTFQLWAVTGPAERRTRGSGG
jgi:hypothetical protein